MPQQQLHVWTQMMGGRPASVEEWPFLASVRLLWVTIGVDGPVDLDWCSDSESSADGRAGRGPAIVVNQHIPATTAAAHSARATATG